MRLIEQVVDTGVYPLTEPGSTRWRDVVTRARADLDDVGCSVLTDFIRPELHELLRAECAELAPMAYYDVEVVNAYNIAPESDLPAGHPARITMARGNAFVPRDRIPDGAIINRLYTSELFRSFVAECFRLPRLHELADPLAGLCLNVVKPGMAHPWHFDTNEFTVSMLTQQPSGGGVFEYWPNIRSADAENFTDVRDALLGTANGRVRGLELRPGALQLFKGRYSLHRVSRVDGTDARHSAIFAYCERPGVIGSVARTRQLFGRVLPEHIAADGNAVRVDQLLD